MAEAVLNQFVPDYAVHPGEILEEIRKALRIDSSDILNLPTKRVFKLDTRFKSTR